MDYFVVRPAKNALYAIVGQIELQDKLADSNLIRGAYIPVSEILGLDEPLTPGVMVRDYLLSKIDLIIREKVPVLRYSNKQWRTCVTSIAVGSIRFAEFKSELETFMLGYVSLSDRTKIILAAEEALYKLQGRLAIDAAHIKTLTFDYLREEEEAGRKLFGWENFAELADSFLLKRLSTKLGINQSATPPALADARAVFEMALLARMLRTQSNLLTKYKADILTVNDISALIDYYFPNPIKPR